MSLVPRINETDLGTRQVPGSIGTFLGGTRDRVVDSRPSGSCCGSEENGSNGENDSESDWVEDGLITLPKAVVRRRRVSTRHGISIHELGRAVFVSRSLPMAGLYTHVYPSIHMHMISHSHRVIYFLLVREPNRTHAHPFFSFFFFCPSFLNFFDPDPDHIDIC